MACIYFPKDAKRLSALVQRGLPEEAMKNELKHGLATFQKGKGRHGVIYAPPLDAR